MRCCSNMKRKKWKIFYQKYVTDASISQFQQCPSPQDNAGHLQDFYALEWAIAIFTQGEMYFCTFHISLS